MSASSPNPRALRLGSRLWDYLHVREPLVPGDAILVLGSSDVRSADHGARLWLDGAAPWLVFSGGRGPLTREWARTEAEVFADRAAALGVPRERMLLETRSTNTGENLRFTRELVDDRGLELERWVLVHAPYLGRRARATFRLCFPAVPVCVSTPLLTFETHATTELDREFLLHRLAGEVHRMLEYPSRGYQAPEEVPADVVEAWRGLVALGYDRSLVP
jgi:uncharacterized SAM-binding protein YcdF (DUF218 family)